MRFQLHFLEGVENIPLVSYWGRDMARQAGSSDYRMKLDGHLLLDRTDEDQLQLSGVTGESHLDEVRSFRINHWEWGLYPYFFLDIFSLHIYQSVSGGWFIPARKEAR